MQRLRRRKTRPGTRRGLHAAARGRAGGRGHGAARLRARRRAHPRQRQGRGVEARAGPRSSPSRVRTSGRRRPSSSPSPDGRRSTSRSCSRAHGFAGRISLLSGDAGTPEERTALVDEFRDRTQILLSTEAGAEGLNLQFCNLVVNYDLPWNPQRIEQRIGRCHRYGQQRDVLVLNFLNRQNAADARLYELLETKLHLFDGVFGASDEILGALESGRRLRAARPGHLPVVPDHRGNCRRLRRAARGPRAPHRPAHDGGALAAARALRRRRAPAPPAGRRGGRGGAGAAPGTARRFTQARPRDGGRPPQSGGRGGGGGGTPSRFDGELPQLDAAPSLPGASPGCPAPRGGGSRTASGTGPRPDGAALAPRAARRSATGSGPCPRRTRRSWPGCRARGPAPAARPPSRWPAPRSARCGAREAAAPRGRARSQPGPWTDPGAGGPVRRGLSPRGTGGGGEGPRRLGPSADTPSAPRGRDRARPRPGGDRARGPRLPPPLRRTPQRGGVALREKDRALAELLGAPASRTAGRRWGQPIFGWPSVPGPPKRAPSPCAGGQGRPGEDGRLPDYRLTGYHEGGPKRGGANDVACGRQGRG